MIYKCYFELGDTCEMIGMHDSEHEHYFGFDIHMVYPFGFKCSHIEFVDFGVDFGEFWLNAHELEPLHCIWTYGTCVNSFGVHLDGLFLP